MKAWEPGRECTFRSKKAKCRKIGSKSPFSDRILTEGSKGSKALKNRWGGFGNAFSGIFAPSSI
jgi:hypothetical protein